MTGGRTPLLFLDGEMRQPAGENAAFRGERLAGSRGLLHHRGVLLRHLIHLVDGGVDLAKPDRLFAVSK
ncbi:hypothetical protein BC360_19375 [Ensifer sp. LC163]|nr:hypothetical protein BC363_03710 [Ensifer sp. LC384]OCP26964.1 hypothetical protein BC361_14230 [Ensifer sp. LC54]OCP38110.1 hypothetical protein BC360_19375 [Ensifer sp. LC163]